MNRVVHNKDRDSTHNSHHEAIEIQSGDSTRAEHVEQPSSGDGADDPKNKIENQPLAAFVDNLAANKPRDQRENDPS